MIRDRGTIVKTVHHMMMKEAKSRYPDEIIETMTIEDFNIDIDTGGENWRCIEIYEDHVALWASYTHEFTGNETTECAIKSYNDPNFMTNVREFFRWE